MNVNVQNFIHWILTEIPDFLGSETIFPIYCLFICVFVVSLFKKLR